MLGHFLFGFICLITLATGPFSVHGSIRELELDDHGIFTVTHSES